MRTAVDNVNDVIADELVGFDATDQRLVDRMLIELDGTPNKAKLGANAILGVSLAAAYAAAAALELPLYQYLGGCNAYTLPVPMMNIMNGGKHADNNVDLQEFMVMPVGAESFAEALRMGAEVYHSLKDVLKAKGLSTAVGDEGGFAPEPAAPTRRRIAGDHRGDRGGRLRARRGRRASPSTRPPASFFEDGKYVLAERGPQPELAPRWSTSTRSWCDKYPIICIEDGLAEDDWDGWKLMTEQLGDKIQIVGDDLFVTNTERLAAGIELGVRQLDPHQAQPDRHAHRDARRHRDGQARRLDGRVSTAPARPRTRRIADLAVATNAGQIKTGAPARTDRVAKYNQLLRIEEMLGEVAHYPGAGAFYNLKK